ncbi:ACT domain-containing protein [Desulfitobacterium chlororespirans]|uniref:Uncharacterized protein n=1 Tax=Desulfitobacterium chlororespirans DSM 11544 TaxID=1121395 RepID=A0A1M7UM37_9FIRM|nr:ACT domain-containing protein [Desulfitobacterium chlororespirans]SHN84018.1 hypothetical protein SAMN02745215_04136 [Desulfitobacterium chlororespirans DSM 11544]
MLKQFNLKVFEEILGICRLDSNAQVPEWAEGKFLSITRTADELSIVCSQKHIPQHVECEGNWRYFRIEGILDFSLIGVLSYLSGLLASQGISIFVISTYDTDYLLIKEQELDKALAALRAEGHQVTLAGG